MKTKITAVALIAVTAGVFAYTRPHKALPSDLRDAVADNGKFDTAIPVIEKDKANVPLPKAAPADVGVLGVSKSFSDIFVLAPVSGRLISYTRERPPSKHKLVIRLDCRKSVFGFSKSCGTKSAEVAVAPDGSFQTPALSIPSSSVLQYNADIQLFHADSPNPVAVRSYLGVDNNNTGDMDKLIRDLKNISVYEIPRMHLEFELKSGGPVEGYIRGPQFKDALFVVENSYEAVGSNMSFGSSRSGESGEFYDKRRPLDQYFLGGDIAYAPGLDAPPSKVYVYLYAAMARLNLIKQGCLTGSSCRVLINDVDPSPAD